MFVSKPLELKEQLGLSYSLDRAIQDQVLPQGKHLYYSKGKRIGPYICAYIIKAWTNVQSRTSAPYLESMSYSIVSMVELSF